MDRQKPEIVGQLAEPDEIVASALVNNCASISYTYTEPTIFYEFALDTARIAKTKGLKNIFVSNGFINPAPLEKIAPFLDAANVDLKSFSEDYYRQICGARLQPVLETLKLMKKLGIWLEVTTLVIPGLNDSDDELWQIASFIKEELSADVPWHISGFYPTYKLLDRPPTDEATLNRGREIGLKMGLNYVYTGNRRIPGSEDTYCSKCQRAVIKRSGFQVKENNLKMASCSFCGEKIAGVFMP
ncbi:AmmeMemoRadiSam system radical SAM enzyme [candidate division WOR-1 bacterium RIFOXYB2_FULL_48_7]|uniref:AmmeMemoRadiSam system radical SAM enzyme n=1 Tax=candidate division WOR-1 bacterium RIFOXYB2_FULL_48_7 TaxID=1802583 RepID=A0A1F4TF21_UNCSA|nr:MAG: AmmeMemoRadiSam system radical SAM enzyme [candidate division WOR-1 bacterium RIFOXYB2_FULL_48_7]